MISAVVFGKYKNADLNNSLSEALAFGESQKAMIEEYFKAHGQMPHSGTDAGLEGFTPSGVLKGLNWQPGAPSDSDPETLLTGTLHGLVILKEYGERFEDFESAYLLITTAQEDGTIVWDCKADRVSRDALPVRYLPETCVSVSDTEEYQVLTALRQAVSNKREG